MAAVLVGGFVGAGFASGRELYEFFGRFGPAGFGGVVVTGVLVAAFTAALLDRARRGDISHYGAMLEDLAGRHIRRLFEPTFALGLFVGLAVTLAGGGQLVTHFARISPVLSVIGWGVVTWAWTRSGPTALVRLNLTMVPVLILLMGWLALPFAEHAAVAVTWNGAGAHSAVLYFLYNNLLALALIASLGRRLRGVWEATAVGTAVGGTVVFMAFAVLVAERAAPASLAHPLPLLWLAYRHGVGVGQAYAVALGAALLTTAVGTGFSLDQRLGHHGGRLAVVIAGAVALAQVGFVPLVRWGYPLLGYVGAILAVLVAFAMFGRWRTRDSD